MSPSVPASTPAAARVLPFEHRGIRPTGQAAWAAAPVRRRLAIDSDGADP